MSSQKEPRRTEARTFLISVAAELAGMHAQTLRTYDRLTAAFPQNGFAHTVVLWSHDGAPLSPGEQGAEGLETMR